jgi:hypothetical protein
MLSRPYICPGKRGKWWNRLTIDLFRNLNQPEEVSLQRFIVVHEVLSLTVFFFSFFFRLKKKFVAELFIGAQGMSGISRGPMDTRWMPFIFDESIDTNSKVTLRSSVKAKTFRSRSHFAMEGTHNHHHRESNGRLSICRLQR